MKKLSVTLIIVLSIISCEKNEIKTCEIPCNQSDDIISCTEYLTWEEIYNEKIANLVGQTIVIKSKVYWNTEFGYYDEKPEINPAGKIKLLFEKADSYISNQDLHGENRGDLFLISSKLEKFVCLSEKQEKYALNCKELSNGHSYYLIQGKIQYRDWLNVDDEDLTNPIFIAQSNDVAYWSQTFELVSDNICIVE